MTIPMKAKRAARIFLFGICTVLLTASPKNTAPAEWNSAMLQTPAAAVLAAANSVAATPGDHVKGLFRLKHYEFDKAGRMKTRFIWIYQIMDQTGVENWDNTEVNWEPWHENRPEIHVRVISPDGKEHILKQSNIIENSSGNADVKMYSDNKVLRAPLPALSIGAVVLEEVTTSEHTPLFDAGTAHIVFLTEPVHMEHLQVDISLPKRSPFQYKVFKLENLKPAVTKKDGIITYCFDRKNVAEDPEVDSNVPIDIPVYPYIGFSTGKSWKKIAARYGEIVDNAIKGARFPDEIMKQKTDSPRETAVRFLKWIDKKVRYIGLEIGKRSIVPAAPETVLKQGYGDCKDKASLMVAMLRQAGFNAHVALLRVSKRRDIDPGLPGFGRFNHAIVVIRGKPDIWFDATVPLNRTGILPAGDQGHYALIAWKKTKKPVKTPFCKPEENTMNDVREYRFTDKKYMDVTQTVTYAGIQEINSRLLFQDAKPDKLKEGLQSYITRNYRFGKLKKWTITPVTDLSSPFVMTLEIEGAGRGISQGTSAVVALMKGELINNLPGILTKAPEEKTESGKPEKKKEKKRKYPYRLPVPYESSIHYHILPPDGFVARKVPENKAVELGPITFSMNFKAGKDGILDAEMAIVNHGGEVTPEQIKEIRKKIADLMKKQAVIIYFDHKGEQELANGEYKKALESFRKLVKRHPNEPIQYIRLARAYLKTGLGTAAKKTINQAIKLNPKNAKAWGAKGWILQHDELGRRFGHGYDRAGAIAAYKEAIKLDPKEWTYPADLAILLEYDENGRRYTIPKDMEEALNYYKIVADKLNHKEMKSNVPYDLMYLGKFKELKTYADKIDDENTRKGYKLLATVGIKGVKEAIKEAREIQPVSKRRQIIIQVAGNLLNLRRYQDVAALFREAAKGADNAMDLESRADLFSKLRPFEKLKLNLKKPEDVFRKFLIDIFNSHGWNFQALKSITAPEFYSHYKESGHANSFNHFYSQIIPAPSNGNVRQDVALDLMLGTMKFRVEKDGEKSCRFTLSGVGYKQMDTNIYMKKTGKQFVIIGDSGFTPLIGKEILRLADKGKTKAAEKWMKWMSDEFPQIRDSESGLLMGNPIHYFHNDKHRDTLSIRMAAASLMDETCCAKDGTEILESGRGKWGVPDEQYLIDAALCRMYNALQEPEKMLKSAEVLEKAAPKSPYTAIQHTGALIMLGRPQKAYQVIRQKVNAEPDNNILVRLLIPITSEIPGFKDMWREFRKLETENRLNANDYNTVAWACLFGAGPVDDGLKYARTSVKLSNSKEGGYLHTLAALYAEAGRCREARNTLDTCMSADGLILPDENDWYVLGRIAEQYGETATAIEAYKKVKEPKGLENKTLSTYVLAQKRLKILGAAANRVN
ncbi:MAG: DUF3857 domain-containing protein [Acidobacteria bacterium]|nr:DUF3857 domain-containing protein [Acidobacteriota bacterium]